MDQPGNQQGREARIEQGQQHTPRGEGDGRRQNTAETDLARRAFLRRAAIVGATTGVAVASAGAVAFAEGMTPARAAHGLMRRLNPQSAPLASGATTTMSLE